MRAPLWPLCLGLFLLVAGCMKAPDPATVNGNMPATESVQLPAVTQSAESDAGKVVMAVPHGWVDTKASNDFTLQKWTLPEGGQATLTAVGGDLMANFKRWESQFQLSEGGGLRTSNLENALYPTTEALVQGTLTSTQQLGGGDPRADWMLIGYGVPSSPAGPLFVKVLGPQAVLEPQLEEIRASVAALKVE